MLLPPPHTHNQHTHAPTAGLSDDDQPREDTRRSSESNGGGRTRERNAGAGASSLAGAARGLLSETDELEFSDEGDYSSMRRQRSGGGGLAPQHGGASPDYATAASTRDSDFGFGLQMSSRDKAAVSNSKTGRLQTASDLNDRDWDAPLDDNRRRERDSSSISPRGDGTSGRADGRRLRVGAGDEDEDDDELLRNMQLNPGGDLSIR